MFAVTIDNVWVNAGSTPTPATRREHAKRIRSAMRARELPRYGPNQGASTFNPKVAGSIPARPTQAKGPQITCFYPS
jgi:hypothetical protein